MKKYAKRCIVIGLCLGLCLGLCACGNSGSSQSTEMDASQSSTVTESPMQQSDTEETVLEPQPESKEIVSDSQKEKKTIEITLDNWQDYFEIQHNVYEGRDSFGDFCDIYVADDFVLKEEWANCLCDTIEVVVEYFLSDGYVGTITYDLETKEIVAVDIEEREEFVGWAHDETKQGKYYFSAEDRVETLRGNGIRDTVVIEGNIVREIAICYGTVQITRIKGSIDILE